jgi:hypothetical protein
MSDDEATPEELAEMFPRLLGGLGPVDGLAGEVTAALRAGYVLRLSALADEMGGDIDTNAGYVAAHFMAADVERMLAWVDTSAGDLRRDEGLQSRGADLPSRPAAHRRPSGGPRGRR